MMTDAEWEANCQELDRLAERYLRERERRKAKYLKAIPCTGHWSGTSLCAGEAPEFSCDYPNAPVDCGQCICNGGRTSPITGKRPYLRKEAEDAKSKV